MFAPRGKYYGSSDDESSDDEYYKRPALDASPVPPPDPAKKRKPKLAPQDTINKTWERFSKKQFSHALSILPFEPVPASTSSERANELLSAGYERAAEECRRKVRKIIQECKRINTRYRDPGFDLDWDLKWEKGHCLNYLGKSKFRINSTNLLDPNASIPKAVKRVHEIYENPTFMKDINGSDIKQGSLGNCWLIASLSGLANVEGAIRRCCVEYNTRIGIYGFVFYRDGEWIYSIIDDKLYLKSPNWDDRSMQRELLQQIDRDEAESVYRKTYQTGSKALFFCQNKDQNETWAPLLEKAYAKAHGDYASLIGGWIGEGIEDLSGGVTTELLSSDILDTDDFWNDELSKVNEEFMFGCSTGLLDGGTGDRNGIQERHAYNVVEARTLKDGTRLVKLRNPWGAKRRGIWEGAYSDGSKEWNANVQEELGHSFGSDSVFWITYDDMLRKFQHLDRSRLFREADWRCCQRWIGVDVPWLSQYNEKFHIKLTKDSPLVLSLSQLDKRYFKGLAGQFLYDLHFRVHEQGRPDAEDYIVRSSGNYLMLRSVGVELPIMAAGNYSIWLSITAERLTGCASVEEVVKRECKSREENDKLAQVGRAYDLAHSKAAAHLEEVARQRKASQKSKDCDERKKDRRKAWAKRHTQKDIVKAQQAKNEQKKERRKAERRADAERKRAEEEMAAAAARKEDEEAKAKAAAAAEAKAKAEAEEKPSDDKKAEGDEKTTSDEDKSKDEEVKPAAESSEESTVSPATTPTVKADTVKADTVKADEEEDKAEDAAQKDQAVQTEAATPTPAEEGETDKPQDARDEKPAEDKPAEDEMPVIVEPATPLFDQDKAETGSNASSSMSSGLLISTPLDTPRTEKGSITPAVLDDDAAKSEDKVPVPPVDGPPPATPTPASPSQLPVICQYHKEQQERAQDKLIQMKAVSPPASPSPMPLSPPSSPEIEDDYSEDDSSDSPVSDWEDMISDDEGKKLQPVIVNGLPMPVDDDETDDESRPEPWNAICVVGFRVYSKDENLELRVVMEGGALEEGGMGEKGQQDLDNAQVNAGGEREKKKEDEKEKEKEKILFEEKKTDDEANGGEKQKAEEEEQQKMQVDGTGENDDQPPAPPAGEEKTDSGLAPYPIIVSKGEAEFEKASQPVAAVTDDQKNESEKKEVDEEKKKNEEADRKQDADEVKKAESDEETKQSDEEVRKDVGDEEAKKKTEEKIEAPKADGDAAAAVVAVEEKKESEKK